MSLNEGTFVFDAKSKIGEWTLLNMTNTTETNVFKLSGSIRLASKILEGGITAVVSLKLTNTSFSGSHVERVSCSMNGNKDDQSVFKGVKTTTFVRNVEFRLV